MSPLVDAFLRSWPVSPWLALSLGAAGCIYLRGWRALRRRSPRRWHAGQPVAFMGGLALIFLALASPIEPFAALLLRVHMLQHLLMMMAAPPLLWLGDPLFPMLRGLPREVCTYWITPLVRSRGIQDFFARLTHPAVALALFVAATWLWHVPASYELSLRSNGWHHVQHICFLGTALLFWFPVVRPYPSHVSWSLWLLVPFLIIADVQNTVLSALLTFSNQVLYPHYASVPRLGGISALDDQAAAGVLMWVPGSLVFLLPLFSIGVRLLYGQESRAHRSRAIPVTSFPRSAWEREAAQALPAAMAFAPQARQEARQSLVASAFPGGAWEREYSEASLRALRARRESNQIAVRPAPSPPTSLLGGEGRGISVRLPVIVHAPALDVPSRRPRFDLLSVALVGRFLRWRHARLALQLPMMALAAVLIFDGLRGPQVSAMNLAGVLPWIHWRGLLILTLLAAGNFFCMACPFTAPRMLARRWLPAGHNWPRWLRSKWLAVLLVIVFLWAYEAFSLWDSPWWTAWLAIGYFVAAFVIDGLFRGAVFCKYVCPIGQFNFVQSLMSPMEVKVVNADVCTSCRTRDCIRGKGNIPGCELHLSQPHKSGNMDCTFCLDCVHACPHENVGILARAPASELWHDQARSGVGRFSKRPDLAVLVVILVFGAFANAAGMVAPVLTVRDRLDQLLGQSSHLLTTTLFYIVALVLAPLLAVGGAAVLSRKWTELSDTWIGIATRYSYALVPLGLAMWLSHYSFHLLTSYDTVVPTAARFLSDLGSNVLGRPHWIAGCCRPAVDGLLQLEIMFLDFGMLLSLYTAYRIALAQAPRWSQRLWGFVPWAALIMLLSAAGVWIIFQPMQMRGTLGG
jgi:cytochrome c oxidase assembly factor CtaG